MTKVKYKLSKQEVAALMEILELIQGYGHFGGLEGRATMALLKKVYLGLLGRWENLKPGNNSISLSWPEVWALKYQTNIVGIYFDAFQQNVDLRMAMITNKKLMQ